MIVILHSAITNDAQPDDLETLQQVAAIKAALTNLGLKVATVPFTLDFSKLTDQLQSYRPELIFNLVESIGARSDLCHLVTLFLEKFGIPYTGGNTSSLMMSQDKLLAKTIMQIAGLPTAEWFTAKDVAVDNFPQYGPYIIKSARVDGSIGLSQDSLVSSYDSFIKIINDRQQSYGGEWFAERYISGREFNISLLASGNTPEILPIAEIKFKDFAGQATLVDYNAKWQETSKEYINTPRCFDFADQDQDLLTRLKELALAAWRTFEATAYARLDVRVDEAGHPWILELNINPSLAPDAGFAAAAAKAGLSYERLIAKIIETTNRRKY